jgi:kynurenine formamidase
MATRRVDDAARLFHDVRIIDLTHTLEEGIPTYPTHAKYFQMPWRSLGDPAEMNQLILSEHTGTHADSPSHFVPDQNDPARKHIDEIDLSTLIGRAVTLDFGPFEPTNEVVGRREIEAWEQEHVPVEPGDIALVNFRWGHRWRPVPDGFAFLEGWPGLTRDAAEYLAAREVKAVGTDCISLDSGDGGAGELPAHYTLLPRGIPILENLANLDFLPPVSFFIALPLKIKHGTGSPLRAVALV